MLLTAPFQTTNHNYKSQRMNLLLPNKNYRTQLLKQRNRQQRFTNLQKRTLDEYSLEAQNHHQRLCCQIAGKNSQLYLL